MSADNGVYVLQTYGPEFRVAYAQGIDNIFGEFDDETLHWKGDTEMMRQYFKDSRIYRDLDDALDAAERLSYDYDYLEYGVCLITDFREVKFEDK